MTRKTFPALLSLLSTLFIGLACRPTNAASVHNDYKVPLFTIPFCTTPPKIDGVVDDAEWQNALSINAFQTTDGNVSPRQTRVWYTWDADHLYIAMRSPLRPGEHVLQATRDPSRDNSKAVFDDSFEIWLNADTRSPDGEIVYFQYLGNYAGARYDVMFEPTVGNSRPGWESGWKPVNRITPDGKFWEMEIAIPRQSIYRDQPFTDGEVLHGLFVRNFKRPWEQNSIGGAGHFDVPDAHCQFVLSQNAPAIHLLDIADPHKKTFGLNFAAIASADQILKWSFNSDSGVAQTGELPLTANKLAQANPGVQLDKPGEGYYRIHVTSGDGSRTFLDWASHRAFGDFEAFTKPIEPEETPALILTFNPVKNYVRVEGDFINYTNRASIKKYIAQVLDSAGHPLAQQELALDNLAYVRGQMQLADLSPGAYTARLTCLDASGNQILQKDNKFTKKDPREFPWWNTTAGNIEKVIAPWTPVNHDGNNLSMWGRSIQVGAAGLPAQITSQDAQILAAPITLTAETDTGPLTAAPGNLKTISDADHRSVIQSDSQLGSLKVSSTVTTEFDGMYKVQLTVAPSAGSAPVSINNLKIVIPIKPEFAQFFHACGEGIRYGFSYGFLPADKTGQLWTSKQVDGQPMLIGSFIPYVWVGNDHAGLCWFADSDEGWLPSNDTPALEIRRDSPSSVNLVLNLISSKSTLDSPRTITFAFQATPVKPLRAGWRMDTWSTGDSFKDFCRVEPKGGHLIWDALCFTLDPKDCARMVKQRDAEIDSDNFGMNNPKYRHNSVPYFENNSIDPKFAPVGEYFGDQWHARVSDSLAYDKTLADYIVWNLGKWIEQCNIDGWYVDNVRPVACDNIDAGRGYRLPDGRIQPTYQMFDTRDLFLRVRAVFLEHGKSGKFVLHMTNHMMLPWIGAADLALDGEDHVTFPEMGKDFIDFWSPARMRLDYQVPTGVAVTFLEEYQGHWTPEDLHRVTRAYTAMCILNDVLPSANPNGQNQELWRGRDRFGIDTPDVTFIPYWQKSPGFSVTGENILASAWKKPGSLLIAIINRGDAANAQLTLNSTTTHYTAIDAETNAPLALAQNTIQIPIPRHDYRQIIIKTSQN